ncbi:MAG: hypothetical protein IJR80_08055 [Treponema sp.]|nr:hypothetical protein [Treponema sp.]
MKVSGEFLIFLLLLITNSRVFFVESRKDSVVLLAPLAVLLSVFQIFSWGFDIFTGTALILSILVLFSNFHALYRYFERLYVDHYSPLMYIWAISTCLVCIFCLGFLIYFAPSTPLTQRRVNNSTTNVTMSRERYTGSFRSGFEKAGSLQKTNIQLSFFTPEIKNENLPVIVFFPDKRAETYHYIPYLLKLAEKGFTIISADINTKDCLWLHNPCDTRVLRRFGMVISSLLNPFKFQSQTEFYTYNSSLECKALFDILDKNFADNPDQKYIIMSDFMADTAVSDFRKTHPDQIAGILYMNQLKEYQSKGYGFIAQTDPLLATILKIERDRTGEATSAAANEALSILNTMTEKVEEADDSKSAE